VTEPEKLVSALSDFVKSKRVTEVLLEASDDVDWGTVVAVQDAAKGAGVTRVLFAVRAEDVEKLR